jgi:hypothetical protein
MLKPTVLQITYDFLKMPTDEKQIMDFKKTFKNLALNYSILTKNYSAAGWLEKSVGV